MVRFKKISRRYVAFQRRHHKKIRRVRHLRNHPFVVPVATFLVLFFVFMVGLIVFNGQTIGAGDSRVVQLSVDGKQRTVPTRAPTVGELLKRLNITIEPQDIVEPAVDSPIVQDNANIMVSHARPVTVVDNGHKVTIVTAHTQPRKVVENAGVTLFPEDSVKTPEPTDNITTEVLGQAVVVDRSKPAIISLYGNPFEVRTRAKTVGDLLSEKNIDLLPGDTVQPETKAPITPGIQVVILREGQQVITAEEIIPFATITQDDPSQGLGYRQIKQQGSNGKRIVTYEIQSKDGKEVSRKALHEVMASPVVNQIIVKGSKVVLTGNKAEWLAASNISAGSYGAADFVISRESGWRPGAISANRCIGLGQSCNGSVAKACPSWQNDPVCQLNFFNNYAQKRYGGWSGAQNFWLANHWW